MKSMLTNKEKSNWGDYYYRKKKDWRLEVLHFINQSLPSFNEIFDEESFYVFAALLVVGAIIMATILSKCFGVKIREHHLKVDRDWGEPTPAHVFHFPWENHPKEE